MPNHEETNWREMSRLFYLAKILKHMNVQNVGKGKKGIFIIRRFFFLLSFRTEWLRCYLNRVLLRF